MRAKSPAWREGAVTAQRPSGGSSDSRAGGDGLSKLNRWGGAWAQPEDRHRDGCLGLGQGKDRTQHSTPGMEAWAPEVTTVLPKAAAAGVPDG